MLEWTSRWIGRITSKGLECSKFIDIIEREAKVRNTSVKILAQGENQVICTQYKLNECRLTVEVQMHIQQIVSNNNIIMELILEGTQKLGLIINKDETL